MTKLRRLKDRRPVGSHSVADWEKARKLNMKYDKLSYSGYFACPCGSRSFYIVQQEDNVKAICSICEDITIIYWFGKVKRVKNLLTDTWS